jgi:hypothetical protein
MGIFEKMKLARTYQHVYSTETYKDTVRCAEKLARESLALLKAKSPEEVDRIGLLVQGLTNKINDMVADDSPLVAALSLLTAIRILEQNIQTQVESLRK